MTADFHARALAFVDRCAEVTDIHALIAEFRALIRDMKLTSSACGAWSGLAQQRVNRFFFNDWPQDWFQLYEEKQFFPDDPFVAESRRSMTLFLLSELERRRPISPRSKEIFDAARAYGWRDVIGIPVHGPLGYQGLISLATQQPIMLSERDRACLDMISRAIHHRCRIEVGFGLSPDSMPKLTARELECMQWVAVGKTDWEIGQLLGISSATAHFHVEKAKKKLGLASRTEAVARLTLFGLL